MTTSSFRTAVATVSLALAVSACTGADSGPEPPTAAGSPASSVASAASSPPTPTPAPPVQEPANRACYAYRYTAAVAPVAHAGSIPCDRRHTAITFSVGELDTFVDGHLVSVDSDHVQAQVADACPQAFERFVGGSDEARRLTMLRPVWFTPSLRQSDEGANWYRCDAVAIAADERLAPLVGRLQGVLGRPLAAGHYAMCGTAEPGTAGFRRVICSAGHAWRAIDTVDIAGRAYPGVANVRASGQEACQDAASAQADDPLNYRWGYEWPTQQQWQSGQHYGICWTPD